MEILSRLARENASEYRIGVQLALCYRKLGRLEDLEKIVKSLKKRRISEARVARKKLRRYEEVIKERRQSTLDASAEPVSDQPADDASPDEKGPAVDELLDRNEVLEYRKLQSIAKVNAYTLEFLEGYALVALGKPEDGIQHLNKALRDEPGRPGLHTLMGEAYLDAEQLESAENAFLKVLELDENNAYGFLGLAKTQLRQNRLREAIENARKSTGKMYFNPTSHKLIGEVLFRDGQYQKAIDSLSIAISQNPNFEQAHLLLCEIYRQLQNLELAAEHQEWATASREASESLSESREEWSVPDIPDFEDDGSPILPDLAPQQMANKNMLPTIGSQPWRSKTASVADSQNVITVVTGLPRSGTSLMMQMLNAGGITPFTDGLREADEDNPLGYLENDKVKRLATDNQWVHLAQNHSLKVVVQLLQYLPADQEYRFIFMVRNLDEVLVSQEKMLARNKAKGGDLTAASLKEIFAKQVDDAQSLIQKSGMPGLALRYDQIIENPEAAAQMIGRLMGREMDFSKMAACVNAGLYRNRIQGV